MFKSKDDYREYLESLSYEELLGDEWLVAEAESEIDSRLDAIQDELENMDYEELLGQDYLQEMAELAIKERLEDFDEEDKDAQ